MQLTEVLFTTNTRDNAEVLAAHLSELGHEARVLPGDGSKTVWQVWAVERPPREFADDLDFHRFLDGTLQPLAERFDALVHGGTLSYENGVGSFDIGISQPQPDD